MTTTITRDMSTADQFLISDIRTYPIPDPVIGFGRGARHQPSQSTDAANRSRRSLATYAKKTSTAFANLSIAAAPVYSPQSESSGPSRPPLKSTPSSGSVSKINTPTSNRNNLKRISSTPLQSSREEPSRNAPLQAPTSPTMAVSEKVNPANNGKMHQTSSKILRMTTDEDRPFTRDFKDLFATLITSLPMQSHRVRFSKVDETFLSEEAITNLGSLKFSQSNRIPDPKNPARWVVTTTTTTFSMAKEMARSVCQRFVDARLIESADQKMYSQFPIKGAVWQLTPKGMAILKRFCDRNGIEARHIEPLIRRPQMQIVALERDPETDKLMSDKSTIEVIFRRFAGQEGPNLKSSVQLADSDSVSEYSTGLIGVKMARDRRISDRVFHHTFTGKAASDWLLDCCTTIDRRETFEICDLFVKWGLIAQLVEDRHSVRWSPGSPFFQPTKHAIYTTTERGQRVCGWLSRPPSMSSDESRDSREKIKMPKDTNMNRLNMILSDAALRMLFKEHLKSSLCEENLHFYLDAQDFINSYNSLALSGRLDKTESVRETLATAYGLYNSFLAAGAPSELNIDHGLRNKLDSRMTQTDANSVSMQDTLKHVVELIEVASVSVFKLMASDSVPKFIRDPRYHQIVREHEIDQPRSVSPLPQNSGEGVIRSGTDSRRSS